LWGPRARHHQRRAQAHTPVARQAGGLVLAFAGALTLPLQRGLHFDPNSLTGDLLILGAVVARAFYLYLGRDLTRRYGPILVTADALIAGTQRPTRAEAVRPPVRPPGMESSASYHSRAT